MTYTGPIVGRTYTKMPSGRQAQVSGITTQHGATYAIMYWPDTNTQTCVKLDRLKPRSHWVNPR